MSSILGVCVLVVFDVSIAMHIYYVMLLCNVCPILCVLSSVAALVCCVPIITYHHMP